jgi:hypothetical protein
MISFSPAVSTAPVSSDSAHEKVDFHRILHGPPGMAAWTIGTASGTKRFVREDLGFIV